MSERWTVVYAGFRYWPQQNARFHLYYRIEPGQNHAASGRELQFGKELLRSSPGAVLEVGVRISEGGEVSVLGSGRTYKERYSLEPELVTMWAVEDRVNTALSQAARVAQRDEFVEALKPIRMAYVNMNGPQKAQLIAQVVRFISGSGS